MDEGAWFSITALYEITTHTDSYYQVAFHNLSAIKLFDKNSDNATIGIVLNKFISNLRKYEHASWTLEAMEKYTRLTLIILIFKPAVDLLQHIKSCENVHGFMSQQMIDDIRL